VRSVLRASLQHALELRDLLGDVIDDRVLLAQAPLVRLDATQRFFRFSRSHTPSIIDLVTAGRSGSRFATTDSAPPPRRRLHVFRRGEHQLEWFGQPLFGHQTTTTDITARMMMTA
jgi:hypothetical protein